MFPNQNNQYNAIDALSVLSFIIGYSNLIENRQQSAQNDVQAANDKQAEYLLGELKTLFQELNAMLESQNTMLADIQKRLDRLEGKM